MRETITTIFCTGYGPAALQPIVGRLYMFLASDYSTDTCDDHNLIKKKNLCGRYGTQTPRVHNNKMYFKECVLLSKKCI